MTSPMFTLFVSRLESSPCNNDNFRGGLLAAQILCREKDIKQYLKKSAGCRYCGFVLGKRLVEPYPGYFCDVDQYLLDHKGVSL